jgi:hypothetical protein
MVFLSSSCRETAQGPKIDKKTIEGKKRQEKSVVFSQLFIAKRNFAVFLNAIKKAKN